MMNNKTITRKIQFTAVASTVVWLASCTAAQTALEHHRLEVNTKLSETIFLDPVSPSQKTIFVSVKNTSEEPLTLEQPLAQALKAHGYQVVTNPSKAHYLIQANVRQVGKMSLSASQSALGGGYGSALAGVATGAALGSFGNANTTLGGGIAGGIIGYAAGSLVKDVKISVVTDVQISERVGKGVVVHEHFDSALKNGTSSGTYQTSNVQSQFKHYRTRVVSTADRVNLSFKDARPVLEQGVVRAIVGNF